MKRFLIIIFSASLLTVCGQKPKNGLQIKQFNENYTWRTATQAQIDSFYYNLTPIQYSDKQTHIRISISGQIIDLFTNDNKTYKGFLTNTITEYIEKKQKNSDYEKQLVFEKIPLDKIKVKFVIESLISSKQFEIPTDSLIPNWWMGFFDCSSIHFAFKINEQIKTQSFYCPWGQNDSLVYKSIVINNYNLIKATFNLDSIYNVFTNKLPAGKTYSKELPEMMYKMYKPTAKQFKNWIKNKPIRDYRDSVKDTIDNYLKNELSKRKIELKDIDCFETYMLIFGIDGKLKDVRTFKYNNPKLKYGLHDFFADKREIRKCKSKIKEIFKDIDLSFIHLQYEIYRCFSFDHNGDYRLYD